MSRYTPKTPVKLENFFVLVPSLIAQEGRIKGFEKLRDLILEHWEEFGPSTSPFAAIKMALETDRHALFAQVAEGKTKATELDTRWKEYQQYLKGEVDMPGQEPTPPYKKGRKKKESESSAHQDAEAS